MQYKEAPSMLPSPTFNNLKSTLNNGGDYFQNAKTIVSSSYAHPNGNGLGRRNKVLKKYIDNYCQLVEQENEF